MLEAIYSLGLWSLNQYFFFVWFQIWCLTSKSHYFFFLLLFLKYIKQANKQNWNPGCFCSLSEIKWKANPPMSPSPPLPNFTSQLYPTSNAIGGYWKYVSFFSKGKPQILWIIHIKNKYIQFCSHSTDLFIFNDPGFSKKICTSSITA